MHDHDHDDHGHDHERGFGHESHGEHRFRFERVALLDGPERLERQDPRKLVEHLAGQGTPKRILDVGAGTGTFALPLLERFPAAKLGALDVEPRMLGVLYGRALERGLADRLELYEVPGENPSAFPEVEAPFDCLVMVNLYHEIDHRPSYLAALRKVATEGATLVVCDWSPEGDAEFGPPLSIRVPAATITAELSAAGFPGAEAVDVYPGLVTLIARAG